MHITKYLDWSLQFEKHLFGEEKLTAFFYEEFYSFLVELDRLTPLSILHFQKYIYKTFSHKFFFGIG